MFLSSFPSLLCQIWNALYIVLLSLMTWLSDISSRSSHKSTYRNIPYSKICSWPVYLHSMLVQSLSNELSLLIRCLVWFPFAISNKSVVNNLHVWIPHGCELICRISYQCDFLGWKVFIFVILIESVNFPLWELCPYTPISNAWETVFSHCHVCMYVCAREREKEGAGEAWF